MSKSLILYFSRADENYSGLAGVPGDVARVCKGVKVDRNGLAIRGSQAKNAKAKVEKWL